MDFNLKQWRLKSENHHQEEEQQSSNNSLKLPKRELLDSRYQQSPVSASSVLPLFVTDSSDHHPNKIPKMASSYFSVGQWQELELQALIYRHMISGAAVPPELLHLVKKSISPQYYLSHPLNQYYPHYQPALMQSGYWGRGAMDPEPGRCRRTDGKKWRCSRDVVAGQKYCERHVHRGRNRSRKPVEIPTSTITTTATPYGNSGGESLKKFTTAPTNPAQPMSAGGGSSGVPHFTLSGSSPSMDLLHLSRRPSDSITEIKTPFEAHNEGQGQPRGARTLHFFDDWPRSLHESAENSVASTTNLSISMPGNASSDFSLKLGTGAGSNSQGVSSEGERPWGATWGTNVVHPLGGPLAEALRSSASNTSSPTSVLHRLRGSASESYISS